ncbi:hypothetical protein NL676_000249 [Syzygium grande]|nr:hypothetical protein NL676_000249 [Syzygium grande]
MVQPRLPHRRPAVGAPPGFCATAPSPLDRALPLEPTASAVGNQQPPSSHPSPRAVRLAPALVRPPVAIAVAVLAMEILFWVLAKLTLFAFLLRSAFGSGDCPCLPERIFAIQQMTGNRKGLDIDDFEKLLCEIPNGTSGFRQPEDTGLERVSLGDSMSPILVESSKGPHSENFPNNGVLPGRKASADQVDKNPQVNEIRLPDEQSVAFAFADLNLESGLAGEAVCIPSANGMPMHSNSFFIGKPILQQLKDS